MKKHKKLNTQKKPVINELVLQHRTFIFITVILLLFVSVFVKLYQVMIIDNSKYTDELEVLSYSEVEGGSSPRGRILDRNGNVIVDNKAIKTIVYQKSKSTTTKEEINLAYTVSEHIELDTSKLTTRMLKEFYLNKYPKKASNKITDEEYEKYDQRKLTAKELENLKLERITDEDLSVFTDIDKKTAYLYYLMRKGYTYSEKEIKAENVTDEEYAYIAENNGDLNGFNTKLDWERTYPYGDTFRTMLGNVSTSSQGIPAEEKDAYLSMGYALNDRVGISYIEKQYEEYLVGEKSVYTVVNSHETTLKEEGSRGNDIVLTIDINLQQQVEAILAEEVVNAKSEPNTAYYDHSFVVIQDPSTGEVLAMAGKQAVMENGTYVAKDYTPAILTSPMTPGSVVKGASMLVGYNTGAVKIGEYLVDECIKIKGTPEKCSYKTLGRINDIDALAMSSNVYQFKIAMRVTGYEYSRDMGLPFSQSAFDTYRNMYHQFGLGVKTEIDLPVESLGYTSEDTAAGNLLDFVMGQYETYTAIQLSQYINTIANSGTRYQPHLLKEVRASTESLELGEVIYSFEPNALNTVETQPEYMARVKEGFYAVVNASNGYGRGYIDPQYQGAGKTGTSQSFIDTDNDGTIDTETISSAFVGYAPATDPKISIAVASPNSSYPNSSSDFASLVTMRITKKVTDKYFEMYPL